MNDHLRTGIPFLMLWASMITPWPDLSTRMAEHSFEEEKLTIIDTISAESLVKDIFIRGSCLNVDNARIIGDHRGVGYFKNKTDAISFEEGIFLSSGLLHFAAGPNRSTNRGVQLYGPARDPDLDLMATDSLFDAVGIEFDFVPVDSFVAFRFVFASEEYCEFVGSEFNDVFGFFVSGPGINGEFSNNAINVARVPGTKDLVSVNTVNHLTNNQYYLKNETWNDAIHCRIQHNPLFTDEIEFDGLTRPFIAHFKVIPCETYHIRLVISDVADAILDSGVFLEAKSFNLGGEVVVTTEVEGRDTSIVQEGCENAFFVFDRVNPKGDTADLTFKVTISGQSTAASGTDYLPIPELLTIPKGQQSTRFPVTTFLDGLTEGDEIIFLEIEQLCKCSAIQGQMTIRNTLPLEVGIQTDTVCKGVTVPVTANVSGGVSPYSYIWNDSTQRDTNYINANAPTFVSVQVGDQCGQLNYAENTLFVAPRPEAVLAGTVDFCDVLADHFLHVNLTGTPPWVLDWKFNTELPQRYNRIIFPQVQLPVSKPGTYSLVSVTDRYCTGTVSGQVEVHKEPIQISILDCEVTSTNEIEFVYEGAGTLQVSIDSGQSFHDLGFLKTLIPGKEYNLVTLDQNGCSDWQSVVVPTEVGFGITLEDLTLKLGRQARLNPELNFSRNIIESMEWEPDIDLSCINCLNPIITALNSREYTLRVWDNFGCVRTGSFYLTVDKIPVFVPNAFTPFIKDGLNDHLQVYVDPISVKQIILFSVYDRWGKRVFEAAGFGPNEQSGKWDGTFSGQTLNPGIFVFRVVVELVDGTIKTLHGDVVLIG